MKRTVTSEEFYAVVDILEDRARRFLLRESRAGHGNRVSGCARMGDNEFHGRLARLRDHTGACITELCRLSEEQPEIVKYGSLAPHLDAAEKALNRKQFARLQKRTIYRMLMLLRDATEDLLDLLTVEFTAIAERINPEFPMDLLTSDEIEFAFQHVTEASLLARLQRVDYELRLILNETMALLKGRFHPTQRSGAYEKRRGSWIMAQMFGMAEGLGLHLSRNHSPQQQASLHSAADAVAVAIGRLRAEQREHDKNFGAPANFLQDSAARAVLAEMPANRGSEFDEKAVADNIIRRMAQSGEGWMMAARSLGKGLGEREVQKCLINSDDAEL